MFTLTCELCTHKTMHTCSHITCSYRTSLDLSMTSSVLVNHATSIQAFICSFLRVSTLVFYYWYYMLFTIIECSPTNFSRLGESAAAKSEYTLIDSVHSHTAPSQESRHYKKLTWLSCPTSLVYLLLIILMHLSDTFWLVLHEVVTSC